MKTQIVFGDQMARVTLPESVITAPPGLSTTLAPVEDIAGEIQRALQSPLGRPPLPELVKPGDKVAIAFDDPTVPCFAPVRVPAIKQVIAELGRAGVTPADITPVNAGGIHRKFTRRELAKVIGNDLVRHLGFEAAATIESAIEKARARHGREASIVSVKYPPWPAGPEGKTPVYPSLPFGRPRVWPNPSSIHPPGR